MLATTSEPRLVMLLRVLAGLVIMIGLIATCFHSGGQRHALFP
jgi:hypothetical protein